MIKTYILCFMMLLDHLFTYYHVTYLEFTEELNPIMVPLYQLDFRISLVIRMALISIIFYMLKFLYKNSRNKHSGVVNIGLIINVIIFSMHLLNTYSYIRFYI